MTVFEETDPHAADTLRAHRGRAHQARSGQEPAQAVGARATQEERKRDTRRKIILGGLLLDAAAKEPRFAGLMSELVGRIARPQDKTAFEGWSLDRGAAKPADRA